MTYCLNPNCENPAHPSNSNGRFCINCGSELLLQARYRIVKPLGRGGFGKTFEVDDCGTPKVVKVLLINYPKAVSLFKREAEVLTQLHHPGIPRVDSDGYFTFLPAKSRQQLHCLVMEKIDGSNLQQWQEAQGNQPIDQEQTINWLKQLAEILEQLHEQKYFHRDIKPSNIMIRPNGQLVLIDFGAVREVTETYMQKLAQEKITEVTSLGFTPQEQIEGRAVPQSDFFALGRTFVSLFTGKHPLNFSKNPKTGKLIWRDSAPHVSKPVAGLIDYLMAPFAGKRPQNSREILKCIAEIESILHLPWLSPVKPLSPEEERLDLNTTLLSRDAGYQSRR